MNRLEKRAASVLIAALVAFGGNCLIVAQRQRGSVAFPVSHFPQKRFETITALAQAVQSEAIPEGDSVPCDELGNVLEKWDASLPPPWKVNPAKLLGNRPTCAQLARQLGTLLVSDFGRLRLGSGTYSASIERMDYVTPNPWRSVTGCIHLSGQKTTAPCANPFLSDPWLQDQLIPRAALLAHRPSTEVVFRGKTVKKGADLRLTLDSALQEQATRIAACFTNREHCDEVLPPSMLKQSRYSQVEFRTGMLGMAIIDVDTGRILALSGALSDCTRRSLERPAVPVKVGAATLWPASRPNSKSLCPQMPDSRFQWLLETHPALWPVAPGSTMKPLAVLAGLVNDNIPIGDDARWRSILAESHDQDSPRRIALQNGQAFSRLLRAFDFDHPTDILIGAAADKNDPYWPIALRNVGPLPVPAMKWEVAQAMRASKESGINIDAVHGRAAVVDYLAARRLMDTAIGGGNVRFSGALALAEMFRRIDLRARGTTTAPATHFAEDLLHAPPSINLDFASSEHAARLTAMLSGITSARLKGTAAGACRLALNECPPEGLPDLWGKTGTADAALSEGSPYLKPGVLPTKLFGAVFTDASGRRLAIATLTLRGLDGRSGTLELQSNASAEASLLMIRHLRQKSTPSTSL